MSKEAVDIKYISRPACVQMADEWYEFANEDHFWMRRRWAVVKKCFGDVIGSAEKIGEIGCGNGVVIRQMEKDYDKCIDGFDLNEMALKAAVGIESTLHYYDIMERVEGFRGKYDLIMLFDVLEHIEVKAQQDFLDAALYMLRPGGTLLINVPAIQMLYSAYDTIAGHQQRYNIFCLRELVEGRGLNLYKWTYWGLFLLPLLVVRKYYLKMFKSSDCIEKGFNPPNKVFNALLSLLSNIEPVPQHMLGTSLLAAIRKND